MEIDCLIGWCKGVGGNWLIEWLVVEGIWMVYFIGYLIEFKGLKGCWRGYLKGLFELMVYLN